MSITPLRPQRSMYQIYTDASSVAFQLAARAQILAMQVKDEKDKQTCENCAFMADRFAQKARRAAEKTLTMLNDGTLKEYCKEFDKVFLQFVKNAEIAEKELQLIDEK